MTASPKGYRFFFFIGNSGAGKDTTMKLVEKHLIRSEISVMNLQRIITRESHTSEDFISVSVDKFKEMADEDIFDFYWKIYDNYYGYRKSDISYCIDNEIVGLFNISRSLIPVIQSKYPGAKFVRVTAPIEESKSRIVTRERGKSKNNLKRIERMTKDFNIPDEVIVIDNSSTLEDLENQVIEFIHETFIENVDLPL